MDGPPIRDREGLASELFGCLDGRSNREGRAIGVPPRHDRKGVPLGKAQLERERQQQVNDVHLADDEGLG